MAQSETLTPQLLLHFLEEKINGNPPPSYPSIVQVDMYSDHPSNIFESNIMLQIAEPRYVFTNLKSVKKGGTKINRTIKSIGKWKEGKTNIIKINDGDKVIGCEKLYKFAEIKEDEIRPEFQWLMSEYTLEDNYEVALCCITKRKMKKKNASKKRKLVVGVDDGIQQAAKKRVLSDCPMTNVDDTNTKAEFEGNPFFMEDYVPYYPVITDVRPAATNLVERNPLYLQTAAISNIETAYQVEGDSCADTYRGLSLTDSDYAGLERLVRSTDNLSDSEKLQAIIAGLTAQSPASAPIETPAAINQAEGTSCSADNSELLQTGSFMELLLSTNEVADEFGELQAVSAEQDAEEDKRNKGLEDGTFWDDLQEITPASCIESGPLFDQDYSVIMSCPKVNGYLDSYLENMFAQFCAEEPRIPNVTYKEEGARIMT